MTNHIPPEVVFNFYQHISKLKKLVRKGWELQGVPQPESVADHIFGVGILTMLCAPYFKVNIEKAMKIALIHDVCEALIGDITPHDGIDPSEKQKMEEEAAKKVLINLDEKGEYYEYWKDFEYQRTPEGKLVKEMDRLEMAFQAYHYEKDTGISMEEFFSFVKDHLKGRPSEEILKDIINRR